MHIMHAPGTKIAIFCFVLRDSLTKIKVLYDQVLNSAFCDMFESIQYNACLPIAGEIRGTSRDIIKNLSFKNFIKN